MESPPLSLLSQATSVKSLCNKPRFFLISHTTTREYNLNESRTPCHPVDLWIQPEQASDRTQSNGRRSGFLAAKAPLSRAPFLV